MKRTGLGVRRWVAMAGAWLFAVLGVVGGCRGQMPELDRGMPGTEFAKLTFQEAREEAYKKKRLLMVYLYDNKDTDTTEMERRTWRNPTLAAYCLWHCVTVRYERRDREFGGAIRCTAVRAMRGLNNHPGKMPSVYVMRDAVAPTERNCPDILFSAGTRSLGDIPSFGLLGGGQKVAGIVPTPLFVLLQTDIALEALKTMEPAWRMLHDTYNPAPPPPAPADPLYMNEEDAAARVDEDGLVLRRDHREVEHGGVVIDVLAQLDAAREAAADQRWAQAAGLYTWLWERGEYFDASFRAVRRSILPAEMRELASRHPATKPRFVRLREGATERLRWAERDELTEWFVLNGVVGDEVETLGFLDLSINDIDEGSMMPRAMWHGYRLMMLRDFWVDPWAPMKVRSVGSGAASAESGTGVNVGSVKEVMKHLGTIEKARIAAKPLSSPSDEWASFQAFARRFYVDEACRLHAACLMAGSDTAAWEIADALLKVSNDAATRQTLITTALAAGPKGQARARHLTLLNEADAAGTKHPTLRGRLDAALGTVPVKDAWKK